MIFVDTSVLAAVYIPEALSEACEQLLKGEPVRAISELIEIEMYSVVARRLRMHELARGEADRIIRSFEADVVSGAYRRLSVIKADYENARRLLGGFNASLRTLDALHISVATRLGARLVTADRKLALAARVLKINHQWVGS